jgi:hypothetical protein
MESGMIRVLVSNQKLMAEIANPAAAGKKPGGRRGKKLSTRVDLTPMVDLGFLLITFFIFTTTMSEPSAMKVVMPADSKDMMPVKDNGSLTMIPIANNRVFYYHGLLDKALLSGAYGYASYSYADGIGQVIRDKQAAMERAGKISRKDLMLIVKPMGTSTFQNVVDILDEVTINVVKSYALTDVSETELMMLKGKL